MDTSTGIIRSALPRGAFLGYQYDGDAISLTERPGILELQENLRSRMVLGVFAAAMLYVLVMIFYVEGWGRFLDRLPIYPALGTMILSGATFIVCLERAFRRRMVSIRCDTREVVFQAGWFMRREHRFPFSQVNDIRLDEVTVFRPGRRPAKVPVFVVQWLSGEKTSIAISNNREKLEYLKTRLENACLV